MIQKMSLVLIAILLISTSLLGCKNAPSYDESELNLPERETILEYVLEFQNDNGGFKNTVYNSLTMYDTYYAIEVFELINKHQSYETYLNDTIKWLEYYNNGQMYYVRDENRVIEDTLLYLKLLNKFDIEVSQQLKESVVKTIDKKRINNDLFFYTTELQNPYTDFEVLVTTNQVYDIYALLEIEIPKSNRMYKNILAIMNENNIDKNNFDISLYKLTFEIMDKMGADDVQLIPQKKAEALLLNSIDKIKKISNNNLSMFDFLDIYYISSMYQIEINEEIKKVLDEKLQKLYLKNGYFMLNQYGEDIFATSIALQLKEQLCIKENLEQEKLIYRWVIDKKTKLGFYDFYQKESDIYSTFYAHSILSEIFNNNKKAEKAIEKINEYIMSIVKNKNHFNLLSIPEQTFCFLILDKNRIEKESVAEFINSSYQSSKEQYKDNLVYLYYCSEIIKKYNINKSDIAEIYSEIKRIINENRNGNYYSSEKDEFMRCYYFSNLLSNIGGEVDRSLLNNCLNSINNYIIDGRKISSNELFFVVDFLLKFDIQLDELENYNHLEEQIKNKIGSIEIIEKGNIQDIYEYLYVYSFLQ